MQFRIKATPAARVAASSLKSRPELAALSVEAPFVVVTLDEGLGLDACLESIRSMDAFVGGLIADSDGFEAIAALSDLKSQVARLEVDVRREFIIKERARVSADATDEKVGSQLHGERHTATNDSPQRNDADAEEETENEAQQEQAEGTGDTGGDEGRRGSRRRRTER